MSGSRRWLFTLVAVFALVFANMSVVAAAPAPPQSDAGVAVNDANPAPNPVLGPDGRARGHGPNPFAYLPGSTVKPETGMRDALYRAIQDGKKPRVKPTVTPQRAAAAVGTTQISGTITNASGQNVATSLYLYSGNAYVAYGMSDSSGAFAFSGYAAASYQLAVVLPGTSGDYLAWYVSSGVTYASGAATPIDTTTGDKVVNVHIPDTHRIKGTIGPVVDFSTASVYIIRNGWLFDMATPAADGSYSVDVPTGTYYVAFSCDTCGLSSAMYKSGGYSVNGDDATPVEVLIGDATVNMQLPLELTISGVIRSPSSVGISGVAVEAFVDGAMYSLIGSGSGGTYSLAVAPGKVTLWAWDGYEDYAGGWDMNGGVTPYSVGATVFPTTANRTGLNIKLASRMLITGAVRFETSPGMTSPGDGAGIEAYTAGSTSSFTRTDSSGNFAMVVPAGPYILWVSSPSPTALLAPGWYGPSGYTMAASNARVVSGLAGQTINVGTITLPVGSHLTGALRDKYGAPIENIETDVFSGGFIYDYQQVAPDGSFDFIVQAGTYRVGFYDPMDLYAEAYWNTGGVKRSYAQASNVGVAAGVDTDLGDIAVPVQTVPGAPTSVTATAFNLSASVSWSAPASDGWAPITTYYVTSSPGGRVCATTGALTCTVRSLTNGVDYTFTVAAVNRKGLGASSATSASVRPRAVPEAPTNVKVARRNAGAVVTWTAPANNGSAITDYVVQASSGSTCHSATASCTFTGLTNGTFLTFSVRATNAVGTGPAAVSDYIQPNPGEVRYSGADFYASAAATSAHSFPANCNCVVYIAGIDKWPDALAAAAAGGTVKGPVLFVATTGALNASTTAELTRLKPNKIIVVGGPNSVSDPVFYSLSTYARTVRYWGLDRYSAAAAVSANTFPANCACTVYVAYGGRFPDALSGAAATSKLPGPALLVNNIGALNPATVAELQRLKPARIIVLGGTASVSTTVYGYLTKYAPSIVRYGGADRYEVAANVAKNIFKSPGTTVVYVANGNDYNGALSAAAAAGRINGPLLLVMPTGIPASTISALTYLKPTQIVVVGNTTQISATVYTQLAKYAPVN